MLRCPRRLTASRTQGHLVSSKYGDEVAVMIHTVWPDDRILCTQCSFSEPTHAIREVGLEKLELACVPKMSTWLGAASTHASRSFKNIVQSFKPCLKCFIIK